MFDIKKIPSVVAVDVRLWGECYFVIDYNLDAAVISGSVLSCDDLAGSQGTAPCAYQLPSMQLFDRLIAANSCFPPLYELRRIQGHDPG